MSRTRQRRRRHARRERIGTGLRRPPRRRCPELEIGDLVPVETWADRVMSVQVTNPFLREGRLPPMEVGEVLDLAPALWMSQYSPVLDVAARSGAWWDSPLGVVCALGKLVPPERDGQPSFLLDVAGRRIPLNWTNPDPFLSPWIEATGGLYLDPELDPGGLLEPTGAACRRPYRVVALRRSRPAGDGPYRPVDLERLPDPWDVQARGTYVVDLVSAGGG